MTKKTKCDSFLIKIFSISMICFNVICRTCNCIVFSDFSLASHSLRHLHVVFFHSFVEWGGCSRGEGFYPLTLALLKEVGLWLRTHKCGKIPCQPLNPSDGPNLPYGVIAWISPMNSDDSWWWWAFTFNKQHDLISPHCGKHLTPSPTFSGLLHSHLHFPHLYASLTCSIPYVKPNYYL